MSVWSSAAKAWEYLNLRGASFRSSIQFVFMLKPRSGPHWIAFRCLFESAFRFPLLSLGSLKGPFARQSWNKWVFELRESAFSCAFLPSCLKGWTEWYFRLLEAHLQTQKWSSRGWAAKRKLKASLSRTLLLSYETSLIKLCATGEKSQQILVLFEPLFLCWVPRTFDQSSSWVCFGLRLTTLIHCFVGYWISEELPPLQGCDKLVGWRV